jgi:alcohol dehydrogenase class IV
MPENPITSRFALRLPRQIHYGRGELDQLASHIKTEAGQEIFLITDVHLTRLGVADRAAAVLTQAGARVATFHEVPAEPPTTCVEQAVAHWRTQAGQKKPGFVIGLGGGSVLDTAKIVALCLGHDQPAQTFFGIDRVPGRGIPTVLIPTTAGTGSEVTAVAVLTDPGEHVKARTWSPHLLPDFALVDPALTDSMPPRVTAATGIDALVHAIEAYIAKVSNPYSRALALQAARQLSLGLRRVYANGDDKEARDAVALGAHLAGLAFANSSCAAVHALAYPLGGRFHIPHGEANAMLLVATMRVNLPACREEFSALASAMQLVDTRPEAFLAELESLKNDLGIPVSLSACGVPPDVIPEMARQAVQIRTLIEPNPVLVDEPTAIAIYEDCLHPKQ